MEILSNIISSVGTSDARAVLYYLSRYLKQASHYDEYKKDIFEDDSRSYPSEQIKSLTRAAVSLIEETEGCQIANFEDSVYIKWSTLVGSLENSLDPAPSPSEIEKASAFSESLVLPKPNPIN